MNGPSRPWGAMVAWLAGDDEDDEAPAEEPAHQTTDDNPGLLPVPIR